MTTNDDEGKEEEEDNQLFYTKIYLDEGKRKELSIQIDHRSQLFQNLNEASLSDFQLDVGKKKTNKMMKQLL
jgi:hypothetical protein